METVIFTRVSTNIQDNERQINELKNYCVTRSFKVLKVFTETISGNKTNDQREVLKQMIEYVKTHQVDKVAEQKDQQNGPTKF